MLFDGVCNLCNYWVQFVIKRNSKQSIKMAALQSTEGRAVIQEHKIEEGYLESLVLVQKGKVYTHSSAALLLCKELDGAWKILIVFWLVPKILRDAVYNWVARNRYKWFGKKDVCMINRSVCKLLSRDR